jgi:hypothetical protein
MAVRKNKIRVLRVIIVNQASPFGFVNDQAARFHRYLGSGFGRGSCDLLAARLTPRAGAYVQAEWLGAWNTRWDF